MNAKLKRMTVRAAAGTALIAASILGTSAWATPVCVPGPVTNGCSFTEGGLTFSDFTVTTHSGGLASVTDVDFTPVTFTYNGHTEYGFELSYAAFAAVAGVADVTVSYDVTAGPGTSIVDAYMGFVGNTLTGKKGGYALAALDEQLTYGSGGGTTMDLTAPGIDWTAIDPAQTSVYAVKDQEDIALGAAISYTSALTDAFSTQVPEPGTFALFGAALLGLGFAGSRMRRRGTDKA